MGGSTNTIRNQVLRVFKQLHQARKIVFENDIKTLEAARIKINSEFKKNNHVTNTEAIQELIKHASEVEKELLTSVVQAEEQESGKFQVGK